MGGLNSRLHVCHACALLSTRATFFWVSTFGGTALYLVGGLAAIQQAAITMALTMSLLLIAAAIELIRALTTDVGKKGIPKQERIEGEFGED